MLFARLAEVAPPHCIHQPWPPPCSFNRHRRVYYFVSSRRSRWPRWPTTSRLRARRCCACWPSWRSTASPSSPASPTTCPSRRRVVEESQHIRLGPVPALVTWSFRALLHSPCCACCDLPSFLMRPPACRAPTWASASPPHMTGSLPTHWPVKWLSSAPRYRPTAPASSCSCAWRPGRWRRSRAARCWRSCCLRRASWASPERATRWRCACCAACCTLVLPARPTPPACCSHPSKLPAGFGERLSALPLTVLILAPCLPLEMHRHALDPCTTVTALG